jgi:hypothetical protein
MARRVLCKSQERAKGVTSSNMTMMVDVVLQEKRFSGR